MKENLPYKLYYNSRPARILFVLSKRDSIKSITNMINFNSRTWGGRYNKILVVEKEGREISISSKDKEEILNLDPDYIYSTFPLTSKHRNIFLEVCSPMKIEKLRFPNDATYSSLSFVGFYPSSNLLNKFNAIGFRAILINLATHNSKITAIKRFVDINLGQYTVNDHNVLKLRDEERLETHHINTYQHLDDFFLLFNSSHYFHKVFPHQLSSEPAFISNHSWNQNESFYIFLGSNLDDISNSWNRSRYLSVWRQKYINQLFIDDKIFKNSKNILKFISGISTLYSNSSPRGEVKFISFTHTKTQLETLINEKILETGDRLDFNVVDPLKYEFNFPNLYLTDNYKYKELRDYKSKILIEKPEVVSGTSGGYICDTYIEYNLSEPRYMNQSDWWQFPRKNYIANAIIDGRASRINRGGNISYLSDLGENTSFTQGIPNNNSKYINLEISLPKDEYDFFRTILLLNDEYFSGQRLRGGTRWTFGNIGTSTEGRKMLSIISLFGNLSNLNYSIEKDSWDEVFQKISFWKEEKIFKNLPNKLKKKLPIGELGSVTSSNYNDVIDKISDTARTEITGLYLGKSLETDFDTIYGILKNNYPSGTDDEEIYNEIKNDLYSFIDDNIFSTGVKPICFRCGQKNWIPFIDMKNIVTCLFCGNDIVLGPELKWYYRLNELVIQLYEGSGLYPVVKALHRLQERARNSFIYYGCLDVFDHTRKNITDIDIVCVRDGKLIFGEAKRSKKGFKQKDFDSMGLVAKEINPDILLFTSLDGKNTFINNSITRLNQEFSDLGLKTKAEWLDL